MVVDGLCNCMSWTGLQIDKIDAGSETILNAGFKLILLTYSMLKWNGERHREGTFWMPNVYRICVRFTKINLPFSLIVYLQYAEQDILSRWSSIHFYNNIAVFILSYVNLLLYKKPSGI